MISTSVRPGSISLCSHPDPSSVLDFTIVHWSWVQRVIKREIHFCDLTVDFTAGLEKRIDFSQSSSLPSLCFVLILSHFQALIYSHRRELINPQGYMIYLIPTDTGSI